MKIDLPPIDAHAHINTGIDVRELDKLEAVVFAVTRSVAESQQVLDRKDSWTIWGVGCHPRIVQAQRDFLSEDFAEQIVLTPFVGEIGMDGRSPVPLAKQRLTLRAILEVLSYRPRLASIHSLFSTNAVLDELERTPTLAPILHWWLGSKEETERALDLGCYFSINPSNLSRSDILPIIPLERILTETDHPFGDRRIRDSKPGKVEPVEVVLARYHGCTGIEIRRQVWCNLSGLVSDTETIGLYPRSTKLLLASLCC